MPIKIMTDLKAAKLHANVFWMLEESGYNSKMSLCPYVLGSKKSCINV